jgi:hypothetical protein
MDKNPGSWCHHLQQVVWNHELRITNLGGIGATMTPPYVSEAFAQLAFAIDLDADVAIASFGTNDVVNYEPLEIAAAAQALLDEAAAAGIELFLLTPTPRYDVPGLDVAIDETIDLLRAVVPPGRLLDAAGLVGPADVQSDLVHLNLDGTLKLGRLVESLLVVPPSAPPALRRRETSIVLH